MSAAMVDLDVVAAALGVSTDAGVVEALHPVEQQLDRIIAAVWKVKFDLEGSVPNADQALAVAVGHLSGRAVVSAAGGSGGGVAPAGAGLMKPVVRLLTGDRGVGA